MRSLGQWGNLSASGATFLPVGQPFCQMSNSKVNKFPQTFYGAAKLKPNFEGVQT